MNASGDNRTPGEILSAARSQASLSLEQVAENTRIPLNMLHAIEMDEYHKISGDLYVKSFLRAYGQEVGLDPEELIDVYKSYSGVLSSENDADGQSGWDEQDVQIKRVGLPWGWIAFIILVIALATSSFFWAGWGDTEKPSNPKPELEVVKPLADPVIEPEESGHTAISTPAESLSVSSARTDTLALGWQMDEDLPVKDEPVLSTPSVTERKPNLPQGIVGDPDTVFQGGKRWPFVVRLITRDFGKFEVKRDAETSFTQADFPASKVEARTLPSGELVSGRAYAVQDGFVVYWGVEDHLSLRLGHVQGVEVSFNGVMQDLGRYRDGEEILLDSSRLGDSSGN